MHPPALETRRLHLRCLTETDAGFILRLVNDPAWLAYIGDKSVHSLDDASKYLRDGPMAMYAAHGLGLCAIDVKAQPAPRTVGMCGLLVREGCADVELGYALVPDARGQGLVHEAAQAWLDFGFRQRGLREIHAYTHAANGPSNTVLVDFGFVRRDGPAEDAQSPTRWHWCKTFNAGKTAAVPAQFVGIEPAETAPPAGPPDKAAPRG